MAEVLDDGEFWLPPQFLDDDDFFMDKGEVNNSPKSLLPSSGYESFGFTSDLSSAVESVASSTETDSDEEDYLLGLSRQMARYTLEDDDFGGNDSAFHSEKTKDWVLSSSPESTLCDKQGSTHGGSDCQSRVSSPLLAAEEAAARIRMNNEELKDGFNSKGLLGPAAKNPSGYQSLSNQKLRPTHLQQSQLMKHQHNAQVWEGKNHRQVVLEKNVNGTSSNNNRPLGLLPSAWPPLQQQPNPQNGSGMRAVFLGNPNGKRECAGTGVFLPRPIGTAAAAQPRKKRACSTVLVPARVVEALNLNLDEINAKNQLRPWFRANISATDSGGVSRHKSGGNGAKNPKHHKLGISHEIQLPQEWTY